MKREGFFDSRVAVEKFDYKITAMDSFDNILITGDQEGYLYRYIITPDDIDVIQQNPKKQQIPSKRKIEHIKMLPYVRDSCLVQADGKLFLVGKELSISDLNYKEKVNQFVLNEFSASYSYDIAIVFDKRDVEIFTYNPDLNFFDSKYKRVSLQHEVHQVCFIGNHLISKSHHRKTIEVIHFENKVSTDEIEIPLKEKFTFHKFVSTEIDEFFILLDQMGIFQSLDGQPLKNKEAIRLEGAKVIEPYVQVFRNFLLIIFEKAIKIYSIIDGMYLSQIQISKLKCLSKTCQKFLFFSKDNQIIFLRPTPPELQIKELLQKAEIEKVAKVFNYQIITQDQQKIEQLDLDIAWALVRNYRFEESTMYFEGTNFDPRQMIFLYPNYVIPGKKYCSNENPSKITMKSHLDQCEITQDLLIKLNDQLQKNNNRVDAPPILIKEKVPQLIQSQALQLLIQILVIRRNYFASLTSQKDKLIFLTSSQCLSTNDYLPVNTEEILELLDFALINAYVDSRSFTQLQIFLKKNKIHCLNYGKEILQKFKEKADDDRLEGIIPFFYESFGLIDQALKSWEELIGNELRFNEAVRVLCQHPERTRIFNNMKWIIKNKSDVIYKIFELVDENIIPPVQVLRFIDEQVELDQQRRGIVKKGYLEKLIFERKNEDEVLHTQLAQLYIQQIFELYPASNDFESKIFIENKTLYELYDNFRVFIKYPTAKFNSSAILEYSSYNTKLKDSWMIPEIIALYGRDKRHDDALNKLLQLEEYKWAEQYCCEYKENLLTKLFMKYIEIYETLKDDQQDPKFEYIFETMNSFLKKYCTHPQLDPLEVLQMIPDQWVLSKDHDYDGIHFFLDIAISFVLHQRRSIVSANYLAEMELLNLSCRLKKLEQAHVLISNDTKCAECGKTIGDKIFVVYPNAVCAHKTCVKNLQICPKTGRDFQKYFMF